MFLRMVVHRQQTLGHRVNVPVLEGIPINDHEQLKINHITIKDTKVQIINIMKLNDLVAKLQYYSYKWGSKFVCVPEIYPM
jgi:hypothetical protein